MSEKKINFRNILEDIAIKDKTGTVKLQNKNNPEQKVELFFKYGEIIYVKMHPATKNKMLGQILLKNEYIEKPNLYKALQIQKKHPEKFIGDILIENDYISQKILFQLFKYQIQYILFIINLYDEKEISFSKNLPDKIPQIPYSITIKKIIKIFNKINKEMKNLKNNLNNLSIPIKLKDEFFTPINPNEKIIFSEIQNNKFDIVDLIKNVTKISPINILNILNSFTERDLIKQQEQEQEISNKTQIKNKNTKAENKNKLKQKRNKKSFIKKIKNFIYFCIPSTICFLLLIILILKIDRYNISFINNNFLKKHQTESLLKILSNQNIRNGNYKIIDSWGEYIIIQNNKIISKGPDKKLSTKDDIIVKTKNGKN